MCPRYICLRHPAQVQAHTCGRACRANGGGECALAQLLNAAWDGAASADKRQRVNPALARCSRGISFAQPLTMLRHFTGVSGALGRRNCIFILISKKGFKGESRRYIRLFSLPVSGGEPELSTVSLDKQQQRPILHVHTFTLVHRWGV